MGFEPSIQENRPQMTYEKTIEYNFPDANLIEIFESNLILVKFEDGKSHLTVLNNDLHSLLISYRYYQ